MEKFRTVTKEDRREMGRPVGMYKYEGKIYPLYEDSGDYFVPFRADGEIDEKYFEWWRLSRIEVKELFLTNIMDELLRVVVDEGYTLNAASFSMEEKGPWDKKEVMQEKKKVVAGVYKYLAEPVTEIFLTQGNRILVLEELPVVRDTLASAKNIVALTEVFLNDGGFIKTKTVVIGISNILRINRSDIFVDNMRWSRF